MIITLLNGCRRLGRKRGKGRNPAEMTVIMIKLQLTPVPISFALVELSVLNNRYSTHRDAAKQTTFLILYGWLIQVSGSFFLYRITVKSREPCSTFA